MKDYIGGVILFDETIRQKTTLGPTIPELISKTELYLASKLTKVLNHWRVPMMKQLQKD